MKIGIDANWAIYEKAGIGEYTRNLIKAILKIDQKNEYVLFFNFVRSPKERSGFIDGLLRDAQANYRTKISFFPARLKELLSMSPFPMKKFYGEEVDLFFSPFFGGISKNGFDKNIITIHDLAFLKFPEHRGKDISDYYLKRTKMAIERSLNVIAVSEATRRDLINLLDISHEKIKVIHESASDDFKPLKYTVAKKKITQFVPFEQDFILSVGTLEPRKNLSRLVTAYSMLPHALQRQYKLVLIGQKGWNNSDLSRNVKNLNLNGKIILTGYVDKAMLVNFYNSAKLFVYPSLYEGFGLPVVEAASCGVPIISSNTSSIPEIIGKGALLVNPLKEDELAKAIKSVLISPKIEDILRKRALRQAQKFSWEKAARQTISVFNRIKR